jgi:serine/threonine protein kinase
MKLPERYRVNGDPMRGGMATVFKCTDSVLERSVALKIMPRNINIKRLKDELDALYKIRSKHVVQVYDICIDDTNIGVIQEYVDGKDLYSPDLAPVIADEYLHMLWQIASGISDIHDAGLIHRDIKPNNMKVDGSECILKIYDFGLAREDGPEASTVGFVGTKGFSAPEQYVGNNLFTQGVDVYAFGATALYYALQELPAELKAPTPQVFSSNPFSNLPFSIPEEISNLLYRCLEHTVSNRPAIKSVRDTIKKYLLFNRHRALIVLNNEASYLDCDNSSVSLNYQVVSARVKIIYDGLSFSVSEVTGDVFINSDKVGIGYILPGSCVLTLGGLEHGKSRAFVTFDLSNPEIVV